MQPDSCNPKANPCGNRCQHPHFSRKTSHLTDCFQQVKPIANKPVFQSLFNKYTNKDPNMCPFAHAMPCFATHASNWMTSLWRHEP